MVLITSNKCEELALLDRQLSRVSILTKRPTLSDQQHAFTLRMKTSHLIELDHNSQMIDTIIPLNILIRSRVYECLGRFKCSSG